MAAKHRETMKLKDICHHLAWCTSWPFLFDKQISKAVTVLFQVSDIHIEISRLTTLAILSLSLPYHPEAKNEYCKRDSGDGIVPPLWQHSQDSLTSWAGSSVEESHAENSVRFTLALCCTFKKERQTETKVPGRNSMVTAAIVIIKELSLRASSATSECPQLSASMYWLSRCWFGCRSGSPDWRISRCGSSFLRCNLRAIVSKCDPVPKEVPSIADLLQLGCLRCANVVVIYSHNKPQSFFVVDHLFMELMPDLY